MCHSYPHREISNAQQSVPISLSMRKSRSGERCHRVRCAVPSVVVGFVRFFSQTS
ncbi:hypothetical protein RRSWK_00207 [Rhodopirellula sp. SWK7]|nr:hypothetical protein RRSWK_00207 [Rhodopirellula sp. SWK7]